MYTAEDGDWLGIYLKDGVFYESPVHKVHSFEAVGAGDAFAGALLHSLVREFEPQELIDFSISASVLKLMIQRDFNLVTENEIQKEYGVMANLEMIFLSAENSTAGWAV